MSISGGQSAMEQARYWMWMKKKNILKPRIQASMMNSFNDSWEEQAFAEDAAGALGGCIWPPRSYSCNFCRREFRSAQALGGHMNVHRRDRARLKQSLSPQTTEVLHHDQNHDQNPCKSLGPQYPSQVCTLDKYNHDPCFVAPSSGALSPSRVSANSSTQENLSDHTFVPLNCSSSNINIVQEKYHKGSHANSSPPSGSDSVTAVINPLSMSDYSRTEAAKSPRIEESSVICLQVQNDYVETDLSLGLNFVGSRNRANGGSSNNHEEVIISSKRHKTTDVVSSLPFFLKLHLSDRVHSDVHGLKTTSMDDLDLELRLGDPPKAKKLGCNPN